MSIDLGWYLPTRQKVGNSRRKNPPRWVLATGNDHVLYSTGSRKRECKTKTFLDWKKRTGAEIAPKVTQ